MDPDLVAALRTLAEGQQNLQACVQAQQEANSARAQQMVDMRSRSEQEIGILRDELKRAYESKGNKALIDTKGLGKPIPFSGQALEWEAWQFKFVTWMNTQLLIRRRY